MVAGAAALATAWFAWTRAVPWARNAVPEPPVDGVLAASARIAVRDAGEISPRALLGNLAGASGMGPAEAAGAADAGNPTPSGRHRDAAKHGPSAAGHPGGASSRAGLGPAAGSLSGPADGDADSPPSRPARRSVISREDELFRSRHGAAAYNDLLRERHRSAMAAEGLLPPPPLPGMIPAEGPTDGIVAIPPPVPEVPDAVPSGSGSEAVVATDGTSDVATGSGGAEMPASGGIPREASDRPRLRLRPGPSGLVMDAGALRGGGWQLEHAESLDDPEWKAGGAVLGNGRVLLPADAPRGGFWRLRRVP